jgi:hypothetical protein
MFWNKGTDSPRASRGLGGPVGSILLLEQDSLTVDSFLKQLAETPVVGKTVSDIKHDDGGVFSFSVATRFSPAHT